MDTKKYIYLIAIGAVSLLLMSGCYGLKNYGKLSAQSRTAEKMTIQELEENWQDYTIYYAGVNPGFPTAIMFDPKGDDRVLKGDRWTKVTNDIRLAKLIRSIEIQESLGGTDSKLWRILGPNDQFYGYMFSGWGHVVMKEVDDRTMLVYDMSQPGSLNSPLNMPGAAPVP